MMGSNSGEGEASFIIPIREGDEGLLAKMQEEISNIKSLGGEPAHNDNNSCIFRLPQNFKTTSKTYEPQAVSIGPYHRSNNSLKEMEALKWHCLAYSVKRSGKDSLAQYLESIRQVEKEAKEYYSDKFVLNPDNPDEFLKMLLLDGCFILQFLLFSWSFEGEKELDVQCHPLFRMQTVQRAKLRKIYADLLLLDNQIPYLVLKQLFQIYTKFSKGTSTNSLAKDTIDPQISKKSLAEDTNDEQISEKSLAKDTNDEHLSTICVKVFSAILGNPYHSKHKSYKQKSQNARKYLHLLDLVRLIFVPPDEEEFMPYITRLFLTKLLGEELPLEHRYRPYDTFPCISKLRRAGIKVNPRKKDSFLKVEFVGGVIEMPTIILDDLMCPFLVSCVAYEQCYNKNISNHFSVYALFLDCLVNTAGDVEYLCDHRVIENYIENEAANFINNLGKGLTFDWDYMEFFMLCGHVNKYYKNRIYRQWTSLKGEYFGKPWLWISGFVALVLLVLTFLQTYYTMRT